MFKKYILQLKFIMTSVLVALVFLSCYDTTPTVYELAPASPTGFNAVADNNTVFLEWDIVDKAMVYIVYMSESENGVYKAVTTTDAISTEVKSLENGKQYFFKLAARNLNGRSSYSELKTATPVAPLTAPISPALQLAEIVDRTASLTWNAVATARSYTVEQSADNVSWKSVVNTINRSFVVKDLAENSSNYFRIVAKNENGISQNQTPLLIKITSAVALNDSPTSFYGLPSDTSVTLFWSKVDNATAYALYRSVDNKTYEAVGNTANTYYTVKNLENGKQYQFKVVPMNSLGASKTYALAVATPAPIAYYIDRVRSLIATSESNAVKLEWRAVANALAYNVYVSEREDFSTFTLYKTVDNLTATVTGLENNKEYNFAVAAVNGRLEGLKSVVATAIPRDILISLEKPYAVNILTGDTLLFLSWSPVTYADRYVVKRSTTSGGPYDTIATVNTTFFVDRSLTNATQYYYTITPMNDSTVGIVSDEVSAIPNGTVIRPTTPTNISLYNTDDYISIDWDDIFNARYFNIYRSIGSSQEFIKISSVIESSVKLIGLDEGVQYNYYITAVNEAGESIRSIIVSTTFHNQIHKPNKILGATATVNSGTIRLTWVKADYATNYIIYLSYDNGGYSPISTTNSTEASVNFFGNIGSFKMKIAGVNFLGEGEASDLAEVVISTPTIVPSKVKWITATPTTKGITVAWQPTANTDEYKLYYVKGAGTPAYYDNQTATVVTIDREKDGTQLTNDETYSFYVTAVNTVGEGTPSETVTVKTDLAPAPKSVVGVTTVELDKQINIRWLPSDYADYYEIYRAKDNDALALIANTVVTNYIDTELVNGIVYRYKIVAVSRAAATTSSPAFFTATPKPQDFRPSAPIITSTIPGSTSAVVVLQTVANASRYRVYYKKVGVATYSNFIEGINLAYTITQLDTNTSYDIVATAMNSSGESVYSLPAKLTTKSNASVPSAPTELEFGTVSGLPFLKWKSGGANDLYYIYFSKTESGAYALFDTTYYNVYAFNSNTNYNNFYFKVRRVSNNMISDFSEAKQLR